RGGARDGQDADADSPLDEAVRHHARVVPPVATELTAQSVPRNSAISGSGSTFCGRPARTAAPGIPNTTAVSWDSAITMPPASRIARAPSTPSSPIPVRMTPTDFAPHAAATLFKRRSALGT